MREGGGESGVCGGGGRKEIDCKESFGLDGDYSSCMT